VLLIFCNYLLFNEIGVYYFFSYSFLCMSALECKKERKKLARSVFKIYKKLASRGCLEGL